MIVFEGLAKLVGYCKLSRPCNIPEDVIELASTEIAVAQRLRDQNAEMRKLLEQVTDATEHNLRTKRWPIKYAAPYHELALINEWLARNPGERT